MQFEATRARSTALLIERDMNMKKTRGTGGREDNFGRIRGSKLERAMEQTSSQQTAPKIPPSNAKYIEILKTELRGEARPGRAPERYCTFGLMTFALNLIYASNVLYTS